MIGSGNSLFFTRSRYYFKAFNFSFRLHLYFSLIVCISEEKKKFFEALKISTFSPPHQKKKVFKEMMSLPDVEPNSLTEHEGKGVCCLIHQDHQSATDIPVKLSLWVAMASFKKKKKKKKAEWLIVNESRSWMAAMNMNYRILEEIGLDFVLLAWLKPMSFRMWKTQLECGDDIRFNQFRCPDNIWLSWRCWSDSFWFGLVCLVLWLINLCRLFNAKSIFM